VQLRSGDRIRVVEVGPAGGPPVLFLGGWGCSVWDFHRTLAPIGQAGFRAIAIDVRGHGLSDKPEDDALYTTDALVLHLNEAIDALDLTRPSIVGHSMGGALAVHLALRERRRVHALVLLSAVGFGTARAADVGRLLSPGWITPIARAALRRWMIAAGLHLVYGPSMRVDEQNVDEYWAPSQFSGFVPAMRALLHGFRWSRFTDDEMARIEAPCLVVRGGCDRVVHAPPHGCASPPACRELVIPEAGHLPHDEAPDRVNAEIIAFLKEHHGHD
jgi:pimeloyl-ACP methyl ester carboxylesterase